MREHANDLKIFYVAHKKPILIGLIVLGVLCAVGMVVSIFIDLELTVALYDPDQRFSWFLHDYGEILAYIVNLGFFTAFFVWAFKDLKGWKRVVLCILPILSTAVFGYWFIGYWVTGAVARILVNVVVFICGVLFFYFLPRKVFDRLFFLFMVVFTVNVAINATMMLIKIVWGRVRFRDLCDAHEAFTHWFQINGVNGHQSFISGHVTTASTILILWLVPIVFKIKNRLAQILLFVLPALYVIAQMYSRLVVGAHYLSDVVFAIPHFFAWAIVILYFVCRQPKEKERAGI